MKKIETDNELQVDQELGSLRVRGQSMGVNWARLSAESHYQVAVEIERALLQGDFDEAEAGIKELIDALGRSEKRALKSQLIRWDGCLRAATREAKGEMNQKSAVSSLSWEEAFVEEYEMK